MNLPDSARPEWLAEDLERVEGILRLTAGASAHPLVAEAATHLIAAGGKRLRPALVLLSARAGRAPGGATDLAAASVELVHLATLYHDDVMDEAQVRRGVPTAHSKWGIEVAVLAGDYLFACGSSLGADAGGEVPGVLARAIAEVCEGQIVETESLNDPDRAIEDHLWTIDRKTGALFRAACELGASTGHVSAERRASLIAYGRHLGRAFQLVDDLLDLVGDPATLGKAPGTDLKEGVFTYAVLTACRRDASLRELLRGGERDLETLLPPVRAGGGIDAARAEAESEVAKARAALQPLPASDWRAALDALAEAIPAQLP